MRTALARSIELSACLLTVCISGFAQVSPASVASGTVVAQKSPAQEPADLKVELRSATGSNRFQLGEVIPLEFVISSSTPSRYLEPCVMFWESCFGYAQCRFVTHWSFDVIPSIGWTDIGWHGCMAMSGPTYDVKSSDLTTDPRVVSARSQSGHRLPLLRLRSR